MNKKNTGQYLPDHFVTYFLGLHGFYDTPQFYVFCWKPRLGNSYFTSCDFTVLLDDSGNKKNLEAIKKSWVCLEEKISRSRTL